MAEDPEPPAKKLCSSAGTGKRKYCLCDLGTGEVVHVCHFLARSEDTVEQFEMEVQSLARQLYSLTSGITDVRVCHPRVGEVVFIVTFISKQECDKFCLGPAAKMFTVLAPLTANSGPSFFCNGTLMPKAHTLDSLLAFLKTAVKGQSHQDHDINAIQTEMAKWFPRRTEFERYIHWDPCDAKKYTRNLIFKNEHMDVLLMCWPPHSKSAIHDHEQSSCFVGVAEGEVFEVQFSVPVVDKNFLAKVRVFTL